MVCESPPCAISGLSMLYVVCSFLPEVPISFVPCVPAKRSPFKGGISRVRAMMTILAFFFFA